jgi:hypothetical protein
VWANTILDLAQQQQQARAMIDRLAPEQLSAVRRLLEVMLDPVSRKLATAPMEDEPISEEEQRAVEASKAWFEKNGGKGIPHEQILAEFGPQTDDSR